MVSGGQWQEPLFTAFSPGWAAAAGSLSCVCVVWGQPEMWAELICPIWGSVLVVLFIPGFTPALFQLLRVSQTLFSAPSSQWNSGFPSEFRQPYDTGRDLSSGWKPWNQESPRQLFLPIADHLQRPLRPCPLMPSESVVLLLFCQGFIVYSYLWESCRPRATRLLPEAFRAGPGGQ